MGILNRLTLAGILGVGVAALAGVGLWVWGLIDGGGASNAYTEMGSGLIVAALIALAILGIERGWEQARTQHELGRRQSELERDERQRTAERRRDEEMRNAERARDVRLMLALQSTLKGADLSDCDLSGMHMADRDLSFTRLARVQLREANLVGCNLTAARATSADMSDVLASGSNLSNVVFERSNLARADLAGADMAGARFVGCDMTDALLTGAQASRADFYKTSLKGADLTGADLTDAAGLFYEDLRGIRCDSATRFPNRLDPGAIPDVRSYRCPESLQIGGAASVDLSRMNLTHARFGGEYRDCSFEYSWFRGVDLYRSRFVGCDFSGADLGGSGGAIGATFENCVYDANTVWPPRLFDPLTTPGLRQLSAKGRPPSMRA